MSKHVYTSLLKDEMTGFVKMRDSQGFRDTHRFVLVSLDKHLVSQNATEKTLTARVIDGWLTNACRGQSTSTMNNYIGYYNSFAKYLHNLGIDVFIPEYVRLHTTYSPYIFSAEEIERIFAAADDIKLIRFIMPQIQFSMLLRLLYGCGLRLGEALTLKKLNVDRDKGVLFIRNAKGNRDRFVPMEPTLTNTLLQYCNRFLRNKSGDAYIFESTTAGEIKNCIGKPRTARWAQQNFRRVLKKAGVDLPELPWKQRNICLHCLRHTFIVRSFRKQDLAGIDNYDPAASISVYVGHHDLIETQRYLHMTAENSMDIINATNKYSKGIFPRIFVAPSSITGPQDTFRVKIRQPTTRESFFNDCSKGMFPGLPR